MYFLYLSTESHSSDIVHNDYYQPVFRNLENLDNLDGEFCIS